VLRHTINVNENSNVEAALSALRSECSRASLPSQETETLTKEVGDVLTQLVDRGKQLRAIGSQMHVTRDISGNRYAIKIVFSINERRTFFQRLWATIRGA
jgi:hypothetical protein